jgi:hypothetical protein
VVLLQTREFESNLGLFLLGHYLPYVNFDARNAAAAGIRWGGER